MDSNFENLKREEQRLMEFVRKSSWRCWIWVLAVAMVAIFISTYYLNFYKYCSILLFNTH